MKILHIFGRLNRGGAEMRSLEIIKHTVNSSIVHHVCCLSGLPGELDAAYTACNVNIFYINLHSNSFIFHFMNLLYKEKYNVIHSHVHHPSALFIGIGMLLGVKGRIVHYRSSGKFFDVSMIRRLRNWILKIIIKFCATDIVAVSKSTMLLAWDSNWMNQKKCKVIYNSIPISKIEVKKSIRSELSLPHDATIICHVGRFDESKNHTKCLGVFREYLLINPNAYLLLCGLGGTKEEELATDFVLKNNLTKQVFFLGVRHDVLEILSHVNVMIFPSKWEGLPGVVLESASVGTPVLASDIPVISEISLEIPTISNLSLLQSDVDWAAKLQHIVLNNNNPDIRSLNVNSYLNSKFNFEKNCLNLTELWLKYEH